MSNNKVSIRFFEDREVRAIWHDENSKWWFSVLDYQGIINLGKVFPSTSAQNYVLIDK